MDTQEFLRLVLSPVGRYCLFTVKHSNSKAIREARTQRFFDSIDDLLQAALTSDAMRLDAYFAVGSIGEEDNRKAYNIQEFKAIFLDIDCGEDKDYPDKTTAYKALRAFCKQYNLPRPIVVDSGNGLHVYWILERPVLASEWKPVAERLKQTCKKYGLRADEAVTGDVSRILRIPGTHNHKNEPIPVQLLGKAEVEVISLEEFDKKLGGLGIEIPVTSLPANLTRKDLDPLTAHYTKNIECSFKKILERTRDGDGCAQIANRIKTKADASYEEWCQMLALAWQCKDRDKAIQRVSSGHPDYDPDTVRLKAATFDGPTLCSTFENTTPGLCAGCPHQGKIKSPIQLGKEVATSEGEVLVPAEPEVIRKQEPTGIVQGMWTIPPYPKGYARGENGGVYLRTQDKDGNADLEQIYMHDLYMVSIMETKHGATAIIRAHLPHDGVKEIHIPTEHLTSGDELRKHLSRAKIVVVEYTKLRIYLANWLNQLLIQEKTMIAKEQLGWSEDFTEYTWGDWTYRRGASKIRNMPTRMTAPMIAAARPAGSKEVYDECIKTFNYKGQEPLRYAVCSAFAAPLMKLTGINLSAKCFWATDSGSGKTAAAYGGLSAFGNPKGLEGHAKDTHNANQMMLSTYKNNLLLLDEMTNKDALHLSNMIYENSDGQVKNRMKTNGNELRERGEPWHTQIIFTANESLIDKITSAKPTADAESQRVLEFKVPCNLGIISPAEGRKIMQDLQDNYGWYSDVWFQYIVDNVDQLRKEIGALWDRIAEKAGLTASNRFWLADAAAVLIACHHAYKLGILPFDAKDLYNWTVKQLVKHKERVALMKSQEDAQGIISRFMNEHHNQTLVIESTEDNRGQHGNGLDNIVVPHISPKTGLVARWEPDTELVYINANTLKKWCGRDDVRVNYSDLRDKVEDELNGKVRRQKKRLSKGTYYGGGPVTVWVIPTDKLHAEAVDVGSAPRESNSA